MCGCLRYSVLLSSCSQGSVRSCAGYFSKPKHAYVKQNIWLDVESSRAQTASDGVLAQQRACNYLCIPKSAGPQPPSHGFATIGGHGKAFQKAAETVFKYEL